MKENDNYFLSVITMTKNGGYYFYHDINEVFRVINGKLHGTLKGISSVRKITTKKFSENYLVVQE